MTGVDYTDRDSGEQSFWYVGDDDSNEKDDGVEPVVAEYEGDHEERDTEEHRHTGDEVDEVLDLARYRRLTDLQARRQVGDAPHHGTVTGEDYHTAARAWIITELTVTFWKFKHPRRVLRSTKCRAAASTWVLEV